jgi:hypothetical protein
MSLIFTKVDSLADYKAKLRYMVDYNRKVLSIFKSECDLISSKVDNYTNEELKNTQVEKATFEELSDNINALSLVNNIKLVKLHDGRVGILTTSLPCYDISVLSDPSYQISLISKHDVWLISRNLTSLIDREDSNSLIDRYCFNSQNIKLKDSNNSLWLTDCFIY